MSINDEMMDTFGGHVTWHKVHKGKKYRSLRVYPKSIIVLIILTTLSMMPMFYLSTESTITSLTLFDFQSKPMFWIFLIACTLILLSGIGLYKRGLRYGAYALIIFTALMLFELNNPINHPSIAFFGIIILMIFILVTKKK